MYERSFVEEGLSNSSCVLCAGLIGDHLRVITPSDVNENILHEKRGEMRIEVAHLERVEPTLEDIIPLTSNQWNAERA